MFGPLITAYLFLGGCGAGSLFFLSLLEWVAAPCRFGAQAVARGDLFRLGHHSWAASDGASFVAGGGAVRADGIVAAGAVLKEAWLLCAGYFLLGILCLSLDIGRFDRLGQLVVTPQMTPMAVGAYALAGSLVVAAAFALVEWGGRRALSPVAVRAVSGAGMVLALVSACYAGLLLSSVSSVLAWQTPLIPILFVLSSLSCGCASLLLVAAFRCGPAVPSPLADRLGSIDGILLGLELAVLTFYVCSLVLGASSGPDATVDALTRGDVALPLGLGVVALGIIAPLLVRRFMGETGYEAKLVLVALLVLGGALVLRWCVVSLGVFDITQLAEFNNGIGLGRIP